MYKVTNLDNYDPEILPHQLYFVSRWGEILDNYGFVHYRKLLQPCSRAVIKETCQVIELFQNKILFENNIFEIFEEVIKTLEGDAVLKNHYNTDYSFVISRMKPILQDKEGFKKLEKERQVAKLDLPKTLLTALLNKMENDDIPVLYSMELRKELGKEKLPFDRVDNLASLLINELLHEGHHKQYLYNWGRGVFITDTEKNFLKRIDRIKNLGKKNSRFFECFIRIKLPEGFDALYEIQGEQETLFYKDTERARLSLDEEYGHEKAHEPEVLQFFKTDKSIARIGIEASDEVSAVNIARDKLIYISKIFTLENKHKQYSAGGLTETIVYDVSADKIVFKPVLVTPPGGLQISRNETYIRISIGSKSTGKYRGLDQLLQWCRVVQDSPRETGLVAIWSLLEFLFVSDYTNKRQHIIDNAIPYIGQYYLKSMLERCRKILSRNGDAKNKLFEEAKRIYGIKSVDISKTEVKLHYLLDMIHNNKDQVDDIYKNDFLSLRYIGLLNKFLQRRGKKLWVLDYIEALEEEIKKDLLRAYRIRNVLSHQAMVDEDFFDDIYEKMSYYIKLILDDLLYSIFKQPDHTVHQLVQIKKESYKVYKEVLGSQGDAGVDYKNLLNTQSLLI